MLNPEGEGVYRISHSNAIVIPEYRQFDQAVGPAIRIGIVRRVFLTRIGLTL